jgi:hypothetical protein
MGSSYLWLDQNHNTTFSYNKFFLKHFTMPQQFYPGQHKFRIFSNSDKIKQAKRRANKSAQMVNLREKRIRDRHYSDVVDEQMAARLAQERYNKISKPFHSFY